MLLKQCSSTRFFCWSEPAWGKGKFVFSLLWNVWSDAPLAQSFESFSEDPYLSGILAGAYISGVQKAGIGSTIKHFVFVLFMFPLDSAFTHSMRSGNDKENDRFGYSSNIGERPLREIYLLPFMLAQKYAAPWAYMTA